MERTPENINGSNQNVIGKVKGINNGEVTKLVSCHESLYPYLMYYYHSVPKVRVYMSDIVMWRISSRLMKASPFDISTGQHGARATGHSSHWGQALGSLRSATGFFRMT
ncbi:hypothetical protein RHGRI_024325 [Rhododendron griersonianum]|uniref:BURP domain-containing protein n=1 Tax=Rhododendron griersonianum TaxID=479676 RepID=A0AAV6JCB1_9ERIC|nr:hypothetical protein RHGRI_024325 [Rhododendron griersonianum]